MNNNLKQIKNQIETLKKSHNGLVNDVLINSKSVIEMERELNLYRPNIIRAALVKENIEHSKSAIESMTAITNNIPDIAAKVVLIKENIEHSKSAINSMNMLNLYPVNISDSLILMNESIENSKNAINNSNLYNTLYLIDNAIFMKNSLKDIWQITQEFNILKYKSIIDFINNLNLDLISKKYENRFFGRYTKRFDLFIRNHGWLIPNCASEDFIDSLHSSFDNNESIDEKFVDYFSKDNFKVILELKEKWTSECLIPDGTMKIISNAINLIINDNGIEYSDIIIPPLLAQIDVLISQVLIKNGFIEKNRKYYNESYNSKDKGNIRTFRENFAGNIIDNWEEHHVNFLLESLFANNHGSDLEKSLILNFNRHNIMHGLDNEYGTFENLIRCLLVIDFLNDFLSDDLYSRLN